MANSQPQNANVQAEYLRVSTHDRFHNAFAAIFIAIDNINHYS